MEIGRFGGRNEDNKIVGVRKKEMREDPTKKTWKKEEKGLVENTQKGHEKGFSIKKLTESMCGGQRGRSPEVTSNRKEKTPNTEGTTN